MRKYVLNVICVGDDEMRIVDAIPVGGLECEIGPGDTFDGLALMPN